MDLVPLGSIAQDNYSETGFVFLSVPLFSDSYSLRQDSCVMGSGRWGSKLVWAMHRDGFIF